MELKEIGKIVNTFGIKGELKIYLEISYFEELKKCYIDNQEYEIEKSRNNKNIQIVKFKNIDDINIAENLIGKKVYINEIDIPELPEGTYYIDEIIGFDVITDEGKFLGKLDNVFNTGANDIYEVGKILLPVIDEVVKEIDLDKKIIKVHIIKGLLD